MFLHNGCLGSPTSLGKRAASAAPMGGADKAPLPKVSKAAPLLAVGAAAAARHEVPTVAVQSDSGAASRATAGTGTSTGTTFTSTGTAVPTITWPQGAFVAAGARISCDKVSTVAVQSHGGTAASRATAGTGASRATAGTGTSTGSTFTSSGTAGPAVTWPQGAFVAAGARISWDKVPAGGGEPRAPMVPRNARSDSSSAATKARANAPSADQPPPATAAVVNLEKALADAKATAADATATAAERDRLTVKVSQLTATVSKLHAQKAHSAGVSLRAENLGEELLELRQEKERVSGLLVLSVAKVDELVTQGTRASDLSRAVGGERDAQLAVRDEEITALQGKLGRRDAEIVALHERVARREAEIGVLQGRVSRRDDRLLEIVADHKRTISMQQEPLQPPQPSVASLAPHAPPPAWVPHALLPAYPPPTALQNAHMAFQHMAQGFRQFQQEHQLHQLYQPPLRLPAPSLSAPDIEWTRSMVRGDDRA